MIDNQRGAVLVTGGAGFVGSYVVKRLLSRGERVVAYDVTTDDAMRSAAEQANGLVVELGSVAEPWRLLRACQEHGVDRIVHLASPLTVDVSVSPLRGVRDICEGTANVFEAARAVTARRVVWASSAAVFGNRASYPPGPLANDAAHRPQSVYGSCKSLCEQMALTYRDRWGVDSIALRLTLVYGPFRHRGYMSFPSEIIRRVAAGRPARVPIADQLVNWQYVVDVAELIEHCLDVQAPADLAFNTSGDTRTMREVGEILQRLVPAADISYSDDSAEDGQRVLREIPYEYSDACLRAQLGYNSAWPLERGIEDSLAALSRSKPDDSTGELVTA
jgi:nucleoside-diphosphate-sugar epimerase